MKKTLYKDIKECNIKLIIIIGLLFIMFSGYTSYSIFTDEVVSDNVITVKVGKKVKDLYKKIESEVKTTNISYKYINGANVTENGIAYNTMIMEYSYMMEQMIMKENIRSIIIEEM